MSVRIRRVWSPGEGDIAVMEALAELAGEDGSCVVGRPELAHRAGVSAKKLDTSLRRLERFGYLRRERRTRSDHVYGSRSVASRYVIVKMPTASDEHQLGGSSPRGGR